MVGRDTIKIDGPRHVREQIAGISFLVSPTAFFQTNVAAAEILVNLVRELAPASMARVADLYAGSGLFTLPLAAAGHRVTAVEENAQAVMDGQANARLNRLDSRVRFIRSRVEDALPRLASSRFDMVVMDPPRGGCPPDALRALFHQLRPPTVIYISCDPDALAREAPIMLDAGYAMRRVQPVDMFPHTTHIETFVVLSSGRA
jgi:23S rRNA (uracil1939-C5)-methyltransferase